MCYPPGLKPVWWGQVCVEFLFYLPLVVVAAVFVFVFATAILVTTVFVTAIFACIVVLVLLVVLFVFHIISPLNGRVNLTRAHLQKGDAIPRNLDPIYKEGKPSTLRWLRAYDRIRYKSKGWDVHTCKGFRFSRRRAGIGR